ncbi:hypothetical protein [Desulfovibrio sp. JC022]|uniref:hypothetical protein n=1 Tax=Desulfovibrio sp. JC022 TaxID=2593642 RepID=UPI0013D52028|nr:hypothetical protein [Desulfovibrio sp. JC022]NDV24591.1 hypothetical protein [Desulfovibrio sp. JC022]
MKKTITAFLLGVFITLTGYIPFYMHVREKWFDLGRNTGQINGLATALKALEKEFGPYDGESDYRTLFSVKATSVVVIEKDGKKEIQIY